MKILILAGCLSSVERNAIGHDSEGLTEGFPQIPQPFKIIDWKQRAENFDTVVFDENASGEDLPILRIVPNGTNIKGPTFRMPSYAAGMDERTEAVVALSSLVSGTLVGVDKENQNGKDWLSMGMDWYRPDIGTVVIASKNEPGNTYWYDLFSCILFFQLADLYPHRQDYESAMKNTADSWYDAIIALGGANADFNHTGFFLTTATSNDNGRWREPDAAAGLAWMMYVSWIRFKEEKYLRAAGWCLDYLERWDDAKGNPVYEVLLYYAPVVAARMNAEHGRTYDIERLLKWCFSENRGRPTTRPDWGMAREAYGDYDVHGLIGSTGDGGGYMFAMNSFHSPSVMAPMVKYDPRFARDFGRWLLNVANNARLFYPDQLPPEHQSFPEWNPHLSSAFVYEGLRLRKYVLAESISEPEENVLSVPLDGSNALVWSFRLPEEVDESWISLKAISKSHLKKGALSIAVRQGPESDWVTLGEWPRNDLSKGQEGYASFQYMSADAAQPVEVRLSGKGKSPGNAVLQKADLATRSFSGTSPYAMGDPVIYKWNEGRAGIDIAIYGSSHAGYLGAVVEATDKEHILRFNLNATDFFAPKSYPVWLYYNPGPDAESVELDVGQTQCSVYDRVSGKYLHRNVTGKVSIPLASDQAVIVEVK